MTSTKKEAWSLPEPIETSSINAYFIPYPKTKSIKFLLYVNVPEGFVMQEKALTINKEDKENLKEKKKKELFEKLKDKNLYQEDSPDQKPSEEQRKETIKNRDKIVKQFENDLRDLSAGEGGEVHIEFTVIPKSGAPSVVFYSECILPFELENFSFSITPDADMNPEMKKYIDPIFINYPEN
jgi:hypothetical protein